MMRKWLRFPVLILAALMLWGCAAGQVTRSTVKIEQLKQSGNAAFDKEDYQTALGFYQEALGQAPSDSWLWNQFGRAYFGLRNYDEARRAFAKSLEIAPDAVVWSNLGLSYHRSGSYAAAASAFEKALEIEPAAARWTNLGDSRYKLGSYAEAITAYTKALAITPADEYAVSSRGWAHYLNRDYNKAIVDFDRLVQSKKYGENALRGRGWSYYHKGMYAEARQDFTAVLRINPKSDGGLRGRGWSHYYTGSFKEAIKDFTGAIENTNPESKDLIKNALHGKALAYLGVGDPETATYLIDEAQAAAPLNTWSLVVFYYLSGDRQKAWQLRGGEGMIGVELQNYKKGEGFGAEVAGISKSSPAARAGFLEGDVVVAVNGTRVSGTKDCVRAIAALQPGSVAEMVALREGREKKVPVRIGSAEMAVLSDPMAAPLVRRKGMASRGGEISAAGETPAASSGQEGSGGAAGDELF
jgi:tetratricopeptide (TPR) repeat protein